MSSWNRNDKSNLPWPVERVWLVWCFIQHLITNWMDDGKLLKEPLPNKEKFKPRKWANTTRSQSNERKMRYEDIRIGMKLPSKRFLRNVTLRNLVHINEQAHLNNESRAQRGVFVFFLWDHSEPFTLKGKANQAILLDLVEIKWGKTKLQNRASKMVTFKDNLIYQWFT